MKIVCGEGVQELITSNGGRVWIWLDPHQFLGTSTIYLMTSMAPLGTTRATRRSRSARKPHRFKEFPMEGFTVLFATGQMALPEQLDLEVKGWGKKRVEAYWNGAIFAGEDVPPPSQAPS